MMKDPKISVITVCYNAIDSIEKTIQSVINQDYDNIEYIIIDGASTDGTIDIINKYRSKITYIVSEPDKGIYDAMNKGVKVATGEWLNFMNAGDGFCSNDTLRSVFDQDFPPTIKFIYGDYIVCRDKQNTLVKTSFDRGLVNHQSVIYKKELHEEHGMYIVTDNLIVSDYLFFIRIPRRNIYKVNISIANYDASGISSNGLWASIGARCVDAAFGRIRIWKLIYLLLRMQLSSIVPAPVKSALKFLRLEIRVF